ncbi:MAG: hypothetical protein MUC59_10960 [Saprospiraceae bacterium]|jgi:hypothetical protein|nr:hypothetical protein [Saprospiraceae bacterium]
MASALFRRRNPKRIRRSWRLGIAIAARVREELPQFFALDLTAARLGIGLALRVGVVKEGG